MKTTTYKGLVLGLLVSAMGLGGLGSGCAVAGADEDDAIVDGIDMDAADDLGTESLPIPGKAYRLRAQNSGLCVDVLGGSLLQGSVIGQWFCNTLPNQQFKFTNLGNGYYSIKNVNSGLCIDVLGSGTAPGAVVDQWSCNSGFNQQFKVVDFGSTIALVARHSNMCLDVAGGSPAPGTHIDQFPCNYAPNQRFSLE